MQASVCVLTRCETSSTSQWLESHLTDTALTLIGLLMNLIQMLLRVCLRSHDKEKNASIVVVGGLIGERSVETVPFHAVLVDLILVSFFETWPNIWFK